MRLVQRIGLTAIKTPNDYSQIEEKFKLVSGENLVNINKISNKFKLAKDQISIIIPTYIGRRLDIVLQNLDKQIYKNFEVIIVDDCSPNKVSLKFENLKLNFPIKYVRLLRHGGISVARNVGLECAESNIIILMDSDMVVPKDLTAKMALRQQFVDKSLFVGFRKSIKFTDLKKRGKGSSMATEDWRFSVKNKNSFLNLAIKQGEAERIKRKTNLVKESVYFKKFSKGGTINYWDLPCMVIGHSLCFKKNEAVKAGGFVEGLFEGWGMDDIAFGASMIAHGNFVIPAIDWRSYHINHKRYLRSSKNRYKELKKNVDLYLRNYLTLPINKLNFVHHAVRRIKKINNITYYESFT